MNDPQEPPGFKPPTPWTQHGRERNDSLPMLQNKVGDPKMTPFKAHCPRPPATAWDSVTSSD